MHLTTATEPTQRYAFTLIELLVVIAVIGLLLGILIPSLAGARREARAVPCAANLRAVGQAMAVYLGVAAVIAPSYGGLFFRNAFNLGLLLLTCADAASLQGQSQLAIERSPLRIVLPDGRALACEPVPDFLLAMAQAGGLLPQLRQRLAAQASSRL